MKRSSPHKSEPSAEHFTIYDEDRDRIVCRHMIQHIGTHEQGYDDTDRLGQRDLMSYLYDLIDTLEEKLLLAELGSDRLAEIGAEICTTADVLKKFNEHIQIALPRFAQLFGADTLAEVLAAANMVATTKIMRHMHTYDAKEGPEDPPPHKAPRPYSSEGCV